MQGGEGAASSERGQWVAWVGAVMNLGRLASWVCEARAVRHLLAALLSRG